MQRKRALQLRREWGEKPCAHAAFAREYDLGAHTGDYVCTTCGRTFTWREKTEMVAARKQ